MQKRLTDNLQSVFEKVGTSFMAKYRTSVVFMIWNLLLIQVQREFHLPAGDFPDVENFKTVLSRYSIDDFEKLKPKMIQAVDDMLGYDIPNLLKNFRNIYD